MSAQSARTCLQRAAALIRLPGAPDREPLVLPDGSGLLCPRTGQFFSYRNGILDLLTDAPSLTWAQRLFAGRLNAWLYDLARPVLASLLGLPGREREVAKLDTALQVRPGDTVLDLACGHGNFTCAWAERSGPDGLVIGLDISRAMLERAAAYVRSRGLRNVLLIRGDMNALPFSSASFGRVNCSGGFHQLPDLARPLAEIARISSPNAVLTAALFAIKADDRYLPVKRWFQRIGLVTFVRFDVLKGQFADVGFDEFRWSLPGGWFGYATARYAGATVPLAGSVGAKR